MHCTRCGKQLSDGTQYCTFCGAPTDASDAPTGRTPDEDFTIAVPRGYIHTDAQSAAPVPASSDSASDFIPDGIQEDIERIIAEELEERAQTDPTQRMILEEPAVRIPTGGQTADGSTRTVSKGDIRAAIRSDEAEPETAAPEAPDEIESSARTRTVSQADLAEIMNELRAEDTSAEETPSAPEDIPDIPIPKNFIVSKQTAPPAPRPRNTVKRSNTPGDEPDEEDFDEEEQIISRRGIFVVIVIVLVLFAIAVGACVVALQGGEPQDSGSGSGEIAFSYQEKS